jgi:hypothetical protein
MEIDFGILPLPWFDEHQREWRHSVTTTSGQVLAVPNVHYGDALDRIGFMLEAVAAESRYTTIPAHHDIQLQAKLLRDDESSEMLDIIFGSMLWELSGVYGWFMVPGSAAGLEGVGWISVGPTPTQARGLSRLSVINCLTAFRLIYCPRSALMRL